MANVNIKFNNKDYLLSCDDGQEESLKKLTKFLDKKYSELKDKLGNIGENKLLLITTIQLIDEYFDLKEKVTEQKMKLDEISKKFKEIRSLAIEYKKDKDLEIQNLNNELEKFRKTIEDNKSLYESMLDKLNAGQQDGEDGEGGEGNPYESPEPVDYRGDFKPEMVQLLTKLQSDRVKAVRVRLYHRNSSNKCSRIVLNWS